MENSRIKVSVYCITYNHEKYIRDALEGIVKQKTNFRYEVFVHDDASTDNTQEIVKEYAKKYPGIIFPILQTENQYSQGIHIFKTHILPKMNGEYIAICEGDDYWIDEYKIQKQVDFLDNNSEYSACVHNSLVLDLKKHESRLFNSAYEDYDLKIEHVLTEGGSDYQTASLMYRKKFADEIFYTKTPDFFSKAKGFGDYPLAIYLTLSGKVRYFSEIMSAYRVGVCGSWSERVKDRKKCHEVYNSIINMLLSVDEYTDYKYHMAIQSIVEKYRFWILNSSIGINALKNKEMWLVFKKKRISRKVKILIKLLFFNRFFEND